MALEEVLIADGSASDRAAIAQLAERYKLTAHQAETAAQGRERVASKFYAVIVVDLELPGGGNDLIEFVRERSPASKLVALTSRKNFDGAVAAFRAGCVDVVSKRPEEPGRLERALEVALDRYHAATGAGLTPVADVLDEFTRTLVQIGRQIYAADIDSLTEVGRASVAVLFVDDDTAFLSKLGEYLQDISGVEAAAEMSGGGALDKIGAARFDVVIAKEGLMDLPGSIAVSAAQQRNPECIALLYTSPGPSGRIERQVEGRVTDTYAPFTDARQLADRVRAIVEEEETKRRERKVLQVIRNKHADLLRRYVEAKRRLEAAQQG